MASRFFIITALLAFFGSGLLPLLPTPQARAATGATYALVTTDGKPLDGAGRAAFNKAARNPDDGDNTKNAVFQRLAILAKGSVWGDGVLLSFQDVNDPPNKDFYSRYSASYYCVGGEPKLKREEDVVGKYGTYRVGVSVALPIESKDNYNIDNEENIEAVSFYTSVEYTPKNKPDSANDDPSHMWMDKGWDFKYSGDVQFNKDAPTKDVKGDVSLFSSIDKAWGTSYNPVDGGDMGSEQRGKFNLPDNIKLKSHKGADLLDGCDIGAGRGELGHKSMSHTQENTIKNFAITKSLPAEWQKAFDAAKKNNNGGEDSSSGATGTAIEIDNCNATGNPLTWFICPIIDGLGTLADKTHESLTKQLVIGSNDPETSNNPTLIFCDGTSNETCTSYQDAWRIVRNIALGLMVLAGLVILLAQIVGAEILNAYTVRKVLPRILVAAIAITLSWELLRFLVLFINDLGVGIYSIMVGPFQGISGEGFGDAGFFTQAGTVALLLGAAGGLLGALTLIATAALAFFVAFIVIVLRNLLITVLLIMAPIAIVMYIMPNTNKYYKMWWENLLKALLMFPIIEAMIASGYIFSRIAYSAGDDISKVVGLVAYFAPFLMIPITFRLAGGLMSATGNLVNGKTQPGFAAIRGYRANSAKDSWQRMRENRRFNEQRGGAAGWAAKRANNVLGNVTNPGAAAKIYGGALLNKAGVNNSIGGGVINEIDAKKMQQSMKLADRLNSAGLNADALGALGSIKVHSAANLRNKAAELRSEGLRTGNHNLGIAASQIESNAAFLAQGLNNDPELGKANIAAASVIAKASQGFADSHEIADVANRLGGTSSGMAQSFVTQAQLAGMRSGSVDLKPGYGVMTTTDGTFQATGDKGDGAPAEVQAFRERHQINNLISRTPSEIASAKPGSLKNLTSGMQKILQAEFAPGQSSAQIQLADGTNFEIQKSEVERLATGLGYQQSGYGQISGKMESTLEGMMPQNMSETARKAFAGGARTGYDPNSQNPSKEPEPPKPMGGSSGPGSPP